MRQLFLVLLAAIVSGCAVVFGDAAIINETPASVAQNIIIGKSGKADVAAKYGRPTSISFDSNGVEVWLYGSTSADANSVPTAHKALEIHFGKDGTATYYLLTDVDPQRRRQATYAQ
jgi:hypothetical protein